MEVRVWDVGKKRMPLCNGADTGFNVTRHESEPTSDECLFARKYGEHLNREEQERWSWFDHPPVQPLLWQVQSLVPTMLLSRRLFREGNRVGLGSAFEVLEPYTGKLACTVLRGAGGP